MIKIKKNLKKKLKNYPKRKIKIFFFILRKKIQFKIIFLI